MVQQSRNFRNTYGDSILVPSMNLHAYFSLGVTQPLDSHHTCNGPSSKYHKGESRGKAPCQANPLYIVVS